MCGSFYHNKFSLKWDPCGRLNKQSKQEMFAYEFDGEGEHLPTLPTYKISAITWRQENRCITWGISWNGLSCFVQFGSLELICYIFISNITFHYYIIFHITPYSQKVAQSLKTTVKLSTASWWLHGKIIMSGYIYAKSQQRKVAFSDSITLASPVQCW